MRYSKLNSNSITILIFFVSLIITISIYLSGYFLKNLSSTLYYASSVNRIIYFFFPLSPYIYFNTLAIFLFYYYRDKIILVSW